jgi:hypothetical protein
MRQNNDLEQDEFSIFILLWVLAGRKAAPAFAQPLPGALGRCPAPNLPDERSVRRGVVVRGHRACVSGRAAKRQAGRSNGSIALDEKRRPPSGSQLSDWPPFTSSVWPVTKPASTGEAR